MLDLFRKNPEVIRESERWRFGVEVVDDKAWRRRKSEYDSLQREFNKLNKAVDNLKQSGADATEQVQQAEIIKQLEVREAFAALQAKLATVGNLVHGSVPIINDEANNLLTEVWGEKRVTPPDQKLKNHVDLVELLGFNVGDVIHESVPLSNDEENDVVTKVWGEKRVAPLGQKLKKHVDLVELLDIVDTKRGTNVGNLDSVNVDEANNVVTKVWGEKRVAPLVQKLKTDVDLLELLGIVDTKKGANVVNLVHDSVSIDFYEANNVVTKVWGEKRVFPPGQKLKNHVDVGELLGIVDTKRGANVGNLMPDSVPNSIDEINNVVNKVWGEKRVAPPNQKLQNHVDLVELLGIVDTKKGSIYLGDLLNLVHDSVSINIDEENNVVTKVWGEKRVAPPGQKLRNLLDLIEHLGIVDTKKGAYVGDLIHDSVRISNEANNVTKVWGEKLVAPHGQKLKNQVDLFELLGIVDTKKGANVGNLVHDWVPINNYESNEETKQHVHLLYSILTATERTISCILENYQREDSVEIPEVLQPLMDGVTFLLSKAAKNKGANIGNLVHDSVPISSDESDEETKQRVLMLYSILTATERTISCILENYEREDGVEIPEVLQPLMDGMTFLPFMAAKNKGKQLHVVEPGMFASSNILLL